jgi:preprotein translocase subunit SecD
MTLLRTPTADGPTPEAEALIKEARLHQRRRHRIVLGALLVTVIGLGAAFGAGGFSGSTPSTRLSAGGDGSVVATFRASRAASDSMLRADANVMSRRLVSLGVEHSSVDVRGDHIEVTLSGVKNVINVLSVIATPADLYFRPVIAGAPAYRSPKGAPTSYRTPPSPTGRYHYTSAFYSQKHGGVFDCGTYCKDPVYASYKTTPVTDDHPNTNVILSGPYWAPRLVLGPAAASGTIIHSAYAERVTTGQWVVVFDLTSGGSKKFNELARTYYETPVANDVDGAIFSAPLIVSRSYPSSGEISGAFTGHFARDLATELNSGPLRVPVVLVSRHG